MSKYTYTTSCFKHYQFRAVVEVRGLLISIYTDDPTDKWLSAYEVVQYTDRSFDEMLKRNLNELL